MECWTAYHPETESMELDAEKTVAGISRRSQVMANHRRRHLLEVLQASALGLSTWSMIAKSQPWTCH